MTHSKTGNHGGSAKMRVTIPAALADAVAAQARKEGVGPTRWVTNLVEDKLAEVGQEAKPDAGKDTVRKSPSPLDIQHR